MQKYGVKIFLKISLISSRF